jgi:hypothetical protein
MWEQKTDDGSIHDKDNVYRWSAAASGAPDGETFMVFWPGLIGTVSPDGSLPDPPSCFAGHCDWRLPTIVELKGIVDLGAPGCSDFTGPCIDETVFGPTVAGGYWSATTGAFPGIAWLVNFFNGSVLVDIKPAPSCVRAVRAGL